MAVGLFISVLQSSGLADGTGHHALCQYLFASRGGLQPLFHACQHLHRIHAGTADFRRFGVFGLVVGAYRFFLGVAGGFLSQQAWTPGRGAHGVRVLPNSRFWPAAGRGMADDTG